MNLSWKTRTLCSAGLIFPFCAPVGGLEAQARLGGGGGDWTQLRSYQIERAPMVSEWYEESVDSGTPNPLFAMGIGALVGTGTGLLYGVNPGGIAGDSID